MRRMVQAKRDPGENLSNSARVHSQKNGGKDFYSHTDLKTQS